MTLAKDQIKKMFVDTMNIMGTKEMELQDLINRSKQLCSNQLDLLENFSSGSAWCFGGYEENGDVKQIRVSEYIRTMKDELHKF